MDFYIAALFFIVMYRKHFLFVYQFCILWFTEFIDLLSWWSNAGPCTCQGDAVSLNYILYPEFIISKNYLLEFLGFCEYKFSSPANKDNLTFFFPICTFIFSFSFVAALAKISAPLLHMNCASGHTGRHVSEFRRNRFSCPLQSNVGCGCVLCRIFNGKGRSFDS